MRYSKFIALLLLIGCSAHKPVNYLEYVCPTYEAFRNMQDTSDSSNCKKIVREGKVLSGHKIIINTPSPELGGILPVIVQKDDGKKLEGFMYFLRAAEF